MNKKNFIKLARLIAKFAEVTTDKGVLIYTDEELIEGVEVTNEAGETVEDGEYKLEDGTVVVVAESKVIEIRKPEEPKLEEPTLEEELEEVVEEPVADEKDTKIAELEAKIAEYEATIEQLNNRIKELEDAAEAPKEEAVALSAVSQSPKTSGALKYFN